MRLLRRDELDPKWDPGTDRRLTIWEITQHLIAQLDKGETYAGELLAKVDGGMSDQARHLAYLLYQVADSKGSTEDAVAYNSLVTSWESISLEALKSQGPTQTAYPLEIIEWDLCLHRPGRIVPFPPPTRCGRC